MWVIILCSSTCFISTFANPPSFSFATSSIACSVSLVSSHPPINLFHPTSIQNRCTRFAAVDLLFITCSHTTNRPPGLSRPYRSATLDRRSGTPHKTRMQTISSNNCKSSGADTSFDFSRPALTRPGRIESRSAVAEMTWYLSPRPTSLADSRSLSCNVTPGSTP